MTGHTTESWGDFFLAAAGATAALSGLIFVAAVNAWVSSSRFCATSPLASVQANVGHSSRGPGRLSAFTSGRGVLVGARGGPS